jgi:sterol desaturase/sphingolipid hydroxylase (fatty acid hydroxylase superfamily)
MEAFLDLASEVYAVEYFGIIIALALLEWAVPRRVAGDTLRLRWTGHIGIAIVDTIVVRLIFPITGLAWAIFCGEHGWGLLNQFALPWWAGLAVTLVAIDLAIYTQHYLSHQIPVLWQVHSVHHADQDYDFTTGLRFHPLEGVVSTGVLLGVIFALGAPPMAVLVSRLLSMGVTFVEHANVRLPSWLDRVLRIFVVTPDMHRIHHSQNVREGQSNFANTFSWWDRLFGTYVDQPSAGHDGITFGLAEFQERKHLTLPWMLAQPFVRTPGRPTSVSSTLADQPSK